MTHTETTRESACHLEQASRCLAPPAKAMSRPPTKKAREGLPTPSAMRSAMSRAPVRSSHDGQRDGILIQPLYREATALVKPVSTLCWQRKRIEPSAPRYGLFPNISVCLGERRGKKAISNSRERNVP